MVNRVFHLVYTSRSQQEITDNLLQSILNQAEQKNKINSITGFLLARDGYFLQLLEGPKQAVEDCFARICKDPRHTEVTVQAEVWSEQRLVPEWSMASVAWKPELCSSSTLIELFNAGRADKTYQKVESVMAILKKFSAESKKPA